jgi:hypothetical protein
MRATRCAQTADLVRFAPPRSDDGFSRETLEAALLQAVGWF